MYGKIEPVARDGVGYQSMLYGVRNGAQAGRMKASTEMAYSLNGWYGIHIRLAYVEGGTRRFSCWVVTEESRWFDVSK